MVLAERHSELLRNGRRSRGPSPNNGHTGGSPDTSSDEDNSVKRNGKTKAKQSEYEEKIRVGRDYQAVCPDLIPINDRKPELLNDRALLVWSPTKDISDIKLEEYISIAKEKYGYNGEQALGMLFWHKHDLERAVMDLANFTPFPDEWTVEDKVLFEQAFQFHGKSFHRIRQMLPDKSIASLVKYYYSWKKTRHRQSVMDRQEKTKASKDGSENGSENGSNEESENDDKVQQNKQNISALKRKVSESTEDLRPIEQSNRINARWSNDELLMAVNGVKKFGRDFQAIAEMLGTKTEQHIRTFFVNYRKKYNLDNVVKEYESERNASIKTEEENKTAGSIEGPTKSEKDLKSEGICMEKSIIDNRKPGSAQNNGNNNSQKLKSDVGRTDDKQASLTANTSVKDDKTSLVLDGLSNSGDETEKGISLKINSNDEVMEIDLDNENNVSTSPNKKN